MTKYSEIIRLVDEEMKEANREHGLFRSVHEGNDVIREELYETTTELKNVISAKNELNKAIHEDDEDLIYRAAEKGYNYSLDMLREAVQLCAMFKKLQDYMF